MGDQGGAAVRKILEAVFEPFQVIGGLVRYGNPEGIVLLVIGEGVRSPLKMTGDSISI
jgi:hypothetical protein